MLNGKETSLIRPTVDFLKDGLFCEWAYFIGFENKKLETWGASEMVAVADFEQLRAKYMDSI